MIIINTLIRCSSSEAMVREVYLSMFIAATRGEINFLGRPLSGEMLLRIVWTWPLGFSTMWNVEAETIVTVWLALMVYITIPIITTITTVIATIIATKVSSSIARKSCFDRNWPWRWEQSHAEWKVFSFSPWTFQHFSIWTFQNMLHVLTSKKTNLIQCRWTTNRRGEYDTQSLDRRLVRGAGGRQVGDHLGDHLSGHLGDHHGNHLSDHLTKHLGNHKHLLKHEMKHHNPL